MHTEEYRTHSRGRRPRVTSVEVASFTTPGVEYEVKLYEGEHGYLGAACTCGAAKYGRGCTKHIAEARTRVAAEKRGAPAHHAEYIHELCRKVFAKPRKGESAVRSYELLLEVYSYRYRTPELEAAVHARHNFVAGRIFGEAA